VSRVVALTPFCDARFVADCRFGLLVVHVSILYLNPRSAQENYLTATASLAKGFG
jgi:hypothetical protein